MNQDLVVKQDNRPIYEIIIESNYNRLYEVLEQLKIEGHRVCIVSDTTIFQHYGKQVIEIAKKYVDVVEVFTLQPGEMYKNLDSVNELYQHLIESKFDRKDFLIALGGGVVGDLTGFVAATYLRGISFIQMPTTLLSMVDSSVGGKTGVDYMAYKNMVGAFKQPKAVYANIATLQTLTDEQYHSGFAEVLKYGYIRDIEFYQWLQENREKLLQKDLAALIEMVYRSCDNKRAIVEKDPTEKGERALLNFGHTVGHAIEKLMDFQLLHGQCVSIGMVVAAYISYKRGNITLEELEDIKKTLLSFHLPITVQKLDENQVLEITKSDKKMDAGKIKFILLKQVGTAIIDDSVTEDEIKSGTLYVMK